MTERSGSPPQSGHVPLRPAVEVDPRHDGVGGARQERPHRLQQHVVEPGRSRRSTATAPGRTRLVPAPRAPPAAASASRDSASARRQSASSSASWFRIAAAVARTQEPQVAPVDRESARSRASAGWRAARSGTRHRAVSTAATRATARGAAAAAARSADRPRAARSGCSSRSRRKLGDVARVGAVRAGPDWGAAPRRILASGISLAPALPEWVMSERRWDQRDATGSSGKCCVTDA